jgi:hypothetical protein
MRLHARWQDWLDTSFSLSMLLASSRQKPIHGKAKLSRKLNAARRKRSDLTLIELSGALEGYRGSREDEDEKNP